MDAFEGHVHPAWERIAAALNHLRYAIACALVGLIAIIVWAVGALLAPGFVVSPVFEAIPVCGSILLLIALMLWLIGFFGLLATPRQSTARAYIVWSTSLFGASFILAWVAGTSATAYAMLPFALGAAASLGAGVTAVLYLMRVSGQFGRADLSRAFLTLAIVYVVVTIISVWVLTGPSTTWRDDLVVLAVLVPGVVLPISVWLMRLLGRLRDTIRGGVVTPFARADDGRYATNRPPALPPPPRAADASSAALRATIAIPCPRLQCVGGEARMARSPLADVADSVLVVVDMQESLVPLLHRTDEVVATQRKLIAVARGLDVPIVTTEQNPERLGKTVEALRDAIGPAYEPIRKMSFSAWGEPAFVRQLDASHRRTLVLIGCESHVCVCQTALEAAAAGYDVHVVPDAVSSRDAGSHAYGLDKLKRFRVELDTFEMVAFQWLREAGTPAFKRSLPYFK